MQRRHLGVYVFIGSLVFCLVSLGSHREKYNAKLAVLEGSEFLPSLQAVRICSVGYDKLAADCFWLRFIGYVGDSDGRVKDGYARADEYLNLITQLDPSLVTAYWFAAFVVGADEKKPETADAIIRRGIRANPNNWYLPYIAGVNQYLYAKNLPKAAKYYRMAARFPEAPKWLERQALILEANIPTIIKDINTWERIYESEQDVLVKARAKEKLIHLWMIVHITSPTEVIRNRARAALVDLGVEVGGK